MRGWRYGKIGLATLMMALIITIINTSAAAPLDISIEEKINTTAEYTGSGFDYTTDVTGYVNITNNGNDDLYGVWIAVDLSNIIGTPSKVFDNSSSGAYLYTSLPSGVPDSVKKNLNITNANYFIRIPHLRPGEKVSYFYDVDDSALGTANSAPFIIDERYNVSKIPANKDVSWEVFFNVSLNTTFFSGIGISNPYVDLNVYKYLSSSSNYYGSNNWTSLGPISNPSTNKGSAVLTSGGWGTADPDELDVTGIKLNTSAAGNEDVNISFTVQGNNNGGNNAVYFLDRFGFAALEFTFDGNVSGTKVVDVFAYGNASIAVNKSGPFQNATGEWVVWKGNATVKNTASGLTYVLRNVTLYATSTGSFTNVIYGPIEEKPNQQLTSGDTYTTSNIQFEYSNVPIIWANATFELIKDTGQGWYVNSTTMNKYNATYNSRYVVIEKIYVIGSYLIKVTKYVQANTTAGSNVFDVKLVVENLGGQDSPYVYVYDMIPRNFSEYNWDNDWMDARTDGNWIDKPQMYAGNGTGTPMSGYDKAYYWRLDPLAGGADGNGQASPTEIQNNQSVIIFYQMQGSGEFRVLDAFLVGIDPMLSMNEQTSPRITVVSGAASTSYESVMALLTGIAGIVAVMTYTRRS
ncbi:MULTISPECIES: hypothetical protein [unclassified Archaeoglobus]|uniref:hypothetical protein n=1 Tax=unclassified Archaeoglobus TaxID=2643606 RepID=UPI0025BFE625|nr:MULTISPECIES: hypothetical protein [unclassified Archaeoglobus]